MNARCTCFVHSSCLTKAWILASCTNGLFTIENVPSMYHLRQNKTTIKSWIFYLQYCKYTSYIKAKACRLHANYIIFTFLLESRAAVDGLPRRWNACHYLSWCQLSDSLQVSNHRGRWKPDPEALLVECFSYTDLQFWPTIIYRMWTLQYRWYYYY